MSETILIFRIGNFGDTLVAMPAIYAIRQRHPLAKLVLLTESPLSIKHISAKAILEPTGWFDSIVDYKSRNNFLDVLRLVNRLRALRPKIVYALMPKRTLWQTWRDRLFFFLVSIQISYIGPSASKGNLYKRKPLPQVEPEWMRLLKVVSFEADGRGFVFPTKAESRLRVLTLLKNFDISSTERILAVCPGSKMPAKIWPVENYLALGEKLLTKYPDVRLVVLGGEEDRAVGRELCQKWGARTCSFAGDLSVYESAAVIELCVGYIGNDSGAMHLAAMLGKKCIALFSARDFPGKWEPYGFGHTVLRHEIACAGCMLEVCDRNNACLRLTDVNDVYVHAARVLEGEVGNQSIRAVSADFGN